MGSPARPMLMGGMHGFLSFGLGAHRLDGRRGIGAWASWDLGPTVMSYRDGYPSHVIPAGFFEVGAIVAGLRKTPKLLWFVGVRPVAQLSLFVAGGALGPSVGFFTRPAKGPRLRLELNPALAVNTVGVFGTLSVAVAVATPD